MKRREFIAGLGGAAAWLAPPRSKWLRSAATVSLTVGIPRLAMSFAA
jgi:hypothetical protein